MDMHTNDDKQSENSLANANHNTPKSTAPPPPFIDNRPEMQEYSTLQKMANDHADKQMPPIPQKENSNKTGLPDNLKSGIENLSGYSMDDVKVHYNSDKPAQLQAHAYAQGTDIHLGSGQEKHLPHEAWHVVQQKQDRVKPTMQMKGGADINDDKGLEKEADVMGAKALQAGKNPDILKTSKQSSNNNTSKAPLQRRLSEENDTADGYNDMSIEQVLGYLGNDPNPDETPRLLEVINFMVNDGVAREFGGKNFVKNLRSEISTELVDNYIMATRQLIPDILPILQQENITSLSIFIGLSGYDPTELNTLIHDVINHPHINQASVQDTVQKFTPAIDGANGKLRNAERSNFVQGRTGEMIGLVGELRSILATTQFSGDNEVFLGRDVDLNDGNNGTQDVDIYYEAGANSFNIEVAATVPKLREKLNSDAQRARYDQIRDGNRNAVLMYAVGDSNIWPEIFEGPHLVNNLVEHDRHLQVDGARWSPRELNTLMPVMQHLFDNFIPSMSSPDLVKRHLATLDPNSFTGKTIPEAEKILGQETTHDGRVAENYTWYKKTRDYQLGLLDTLKSFFRMLNRRDDGSKTLGEFKNIAMPAWTTQKPILEAVNQPLLALNESRDIAKYRSELRKAAVSLKSIYRTMRTAIDSGYSAMRGKKSQQYYETMIKSIREDFYTINPADYDRLTNR